MTSYLGNSIVFLFLLAEEHLGLRLCNTFVTLAQVLHSTGTSDDIGVLRFWPGGNSFTKVVQHTYCITFKRRCWLKDGGEYGALVATGV